MVILKALFTSGIKKPPISKFTMSGHQHLQKYWQCKIINDLIKLNTSFTMMLQTENFKFCTAQKSHSSTCRDFSLWFCIQILFEAPNWFILNVKEKNKVMNQLQESGQTDTFYYTIALQDDRDTLLFLLCERFEGTSARNSLISYQACANYTTMVTCIVLCHAKL